jgi:ATP/maltotriose-dependent transcriptional regulator MalT
MHTNTTAQTPVSQYPEEVLLPKITPPRLHPGLMRRDGLFASMEGCQHRKLLLLVAPAGYAKTTTALQWLQQQPGRLVYLSLEPADNDLNRFFNYLLASLQVHFPGVGQAYYNFFASTDALQIEVPLTHVVNAFAESQEDVYLFLDDFHHLNQTEVLKAVDFLLHYSPPQLHLVICSRSQPRLQMGRLRAQRLVCDLRTENLSFSLQETRQLLGRTPFGAGHPPETGKGEEVSADEVHQFTEGWPAALQLWQQLAQSPNAKAVAQIQSYTASYLMDLLLEEVWVLLCRAEQQLLCATAILHDIPVDLAVELSGQSDAGQRLAQLSERLLFLQPIPGREDGYRMHGLFRQFLQTQYDSFGLNARVLHAQAAAWYRLQPNTTRALEHSLATEDPKVYLELLAQKALYHTFRDEFNVLRRWLAQAPYAVTLRSADLLLARAWASIVEHDFAEAAALLCYMHDNAEELAQHASAHLPQNAQQIRQLSQALEVFVRFHKREYSLGTEILNQLRDEMDPEASPVLRAFYHCMEGVFEYDFNNNPAAADSLRKGITLCQTVGFQSLLQINYVVLSRYYIIQGRLNTAYLLNQQVEQQLQALQLHRGPLALNWLLATCFGMIEWGELEGVTPYFLEYERLVRATGSKIHHLPFLNLKARYEVLRAGYQASQRVALEMLTHLPQQKLKHDLVTLFRVGKQGRALGEWSDFLRLMEVLRLEPFGTTLFQEVFGKLALALEAEYHHGPEAALALLEDWPAAATEELYFAYNLEQVLYRAILLRKLNRYKEAQECLAPSLPMMQDNRLLMTALEFGPDALEAVAAHKTQFPEYHRQLERLMTKVLTLGQHSPKMPLAGTLPDAGAVAAAHPSVSLADTPRHLAYYQLTDREIEVLPLLAQGKSNREIAAICQVTLGTAKRHVFNIMQKFNLPDRPSLIARLSEIGVLAH